MKESFSVYVLLLKILRNGMWMDLVSIIYVCYVFNYELGYEDFKVIINYSVINDGENVL